MSNKILSLTLMSTLSTLVVPADAQNNAQNLKQPNIILIMTDQHRADAMGCSSNGMVITPNLDNLSREGNLFVNAYSSAPSSTPARTALLTGMSPWNHGMLGYGVVAEQYPHQMPMMMRELGYNTIGIGKMHWTPQSATHGFHTTILDESGREESPYFQSDYRKWFATQAFGQNPDATGVGWNAHQAKEYQLDERLHPTKWTGDVAVSTISNYSSDKPLFMKISFARPHSPYDAPKRLVDIYDGVEITKPSVGEWCGEWSERIDPKSRPKAAYGNFGDDYAVEARRNYYASITFVDEQIGDIISALKSKDMYENSLIIFISDHGDMLGDHHMWRKTYAYEGSTAIPFIVKLPNSTPKVVPSGVEIEEPVEIRDVLPTFLAINGATQPEKMDGLSLLELLQSQDPTWREFIDLEHSLSYSRRNYWSALTDGKVKYIRFFLTGDEQLFDLTEDPNELHDLSQNADAQNLLLKMRGEMVQHLTERGDKFVKNGELVIRKGSLLYSPNHPKKETKK